ncbi:MAG: transporter [Caulobacteraceae bacterium]
MKRTVRRRAAAMAACAIAACALIWSGQAHARGLEEDELSHVLELIERQEQRLNQQERQLREQQRQLSEQQSLIERQRREIESLTGVNEADLGEIRGAGAPNTGLRYTELATDEPIRLNRRPIPTLTQTESGSAPPEATPAAAPEGPVGEAPPEQTQVSTVEALPEGQNALLGRGRLVIEPSIEYSRSSGDRFIFRGVAVTTGINIGLIEANDTARDTVAASVAVRYAVTDRLEVEGRVPFMYRHDRVTTLAQGSSTTMRTYELDGADIGDAEFSARYQLNRGRNGAPIFVASARVKSDTGLGPFDVERDAQGVATELATGSGFWGVQGGLSVLYPTDPAVLFANVSYLNNIGRDIDRTFGQANVGHVDPGDSIGFGFGFGFAMNPRFSYSIGYSHSYVLPTETELSDANGAMMTQESPELHVGTMQLGLSFRATEQLTIATSVDFGVTEEAPDVRISLRTPFRW